MQCLKLKVRPAPEAHISDDGRTIFGRVHPMCMHFPYREKLIEAQGKVTGRTVVKSLHPLSAENKTLISNTGYLYVMRKYLLKHWIFTAKTHRMTPVLLCF